MSTLMTPPVSCSADALTFCARDLESPTDVRERQRKLRVAVVDAHPLMRAGIRAVLRATGDHELVGEGATNDDVVRLAEQIRPDMMLVAMDWPDSDALAAISRVTARDPHPLVVVLATALEDGLVVAAVRAGASGLLPSDCAEADIVATMRAVATGDVVVPPRALPLLAASVRPSLPSAEQRTARANYHALSDRERAVLELVASGLTGPQIGQKLRITSKTVDTYRHRIREKIGLFHRADYVRFALVLGLLKR